MMVPRVLVAGIGNIFFGDDAFGVEAVKRLAQRPLPAGVEVVDYGIRGFDLAHALTSGYSAAVLVDALPRGGEPGTLYVLEPDLASLGELPPSPDGHGMDPVRVLRLAKIMGEGLPRVLVVGCEPLSIEPELNGGGGLTPPVEAALSGAVDLVESMLNDLIEGRRAEC